MVKRIDPPKLTVKSGCLNLDGEMLLGVYDIGDWDSCPWPMPDDDEHRERLAKALYDDRECSDVHFDAVILPDGTRFEFDQYVR